MKRVVFHIDVNSAFLSWSAVKELENGISRDLRLIPSVVGGDEKSRHGIVLAKSIPAKKYGIVTGEALYSARLKCPGLVSVRGDSNYYAEKSRQTMELISMYSDRVSKYSIDECFVEYTGMEHLFGDAVNIAYEIKERIKNELGFTVNVGVGSNKLLAKMAGDFEKPDKVHILMTEHVKEKMWPLPVSDLFMVGRQTIKALKKIGVSTIGDLANCDTELLKKQFKSFGTVLYRYANGIDDSDISGWETKGSPPKSVSMSWTLPKDVRDYEEGHRMILCLTEAVARRLRQLNLSAGVVSVFIKNSSFKVYGSQQKLCQRTDCTEVIYEKAVEIFGTLWQCESIRLLGVRVSDFAEDAYIQMNMFETDTDKLRRLNKAVDKIRDKFGQTAVFRGSLYNERGKTRVNSAFTVNR